MLLPHLSLFFFFNDTATTEIYTLSLHDALPISPSSARPGTASPGGSWTRTGWPSARYRPWASRGRPRDRKSTRLNSSHVRISYAVFCLKKKTKKVCTETRGLAKHDEHYIRVARQ